MSELIQELVYVKNELSKWIEDESSDADFIYNAKDKVEEILKGLKVEIKVKK